LDDPIKLLTKFSLILLFL